MFYAKRVCKAGLLLALVVVAAAWQGCGTDQIVAPTVADSRVGSFESAVTANPLDDLDAWTVVGTGKVVPGQSAVVSGSRYTLTFPKGSVKRSTIITISEHHPNIMDVELGPSDMVFKEPVTLTMDYRGTANDPFAAPGASPSAYSYNDFNGTWEKLEGIDDPAARTYTVELTHFSRFALSNPGGNLTRRVTDEDVESF
jgi:hypothetical protein